MAYGEKYFHEYCDSSGQTCRVSILFDSYVGATTEVEGQQVPFLKTYDTDGDFLFESIRPSTGSAFLAFGTGNGVDFEEFWTADEREIQVQHIVGGNLDWIGFVIPNGFAHELKGGIYYGTITAADGLSTLEDIDFADDGVPYGTQDLTYNNGFLFPWILIATEILQKLDLSLNLWTCIDVYEQSMTKTGDTRDADPLATSYVNVKTYINDTQRKDIPYWADVNQVMNCKQVLENLCIEFGAKVYQNGGVWRIKRVNSDANYGSGATQRYWRKYNTAAVYLGRETINDDVVIPCATIAAAMIGTDHVQRMDDVFGAFRINYDFTFVRDGDEPENVILNSNFENWTNDSKLSAPPNWFRWREGGNWHLGMIPYDASLDNPKPPGVDTAVTLGVQSGSFSSSNIDFTAHPWNSLRYAQDIPIDKGDRLIMTVWQKIAFLNDDTGGSYAGGYRIRLVGDDNRDYLVQNQYGANQPVTGASWIEDDNGEKVTGDIFLALGFSNYSSSPRETLAERKIYRWRKFSVYFEEAPAGGFLTIDIIGLLRTTGKTSKNFPPFKTWAGTQYFNMYTPRAGEFVDMGGDVDRLVVTGLSLGTIPDENEFAPNLDYIYENPNGKYTLEVDPLTVLNGDVLDDNHISGIDVPTNVSGLKNFWDTIDNAFGNSSLGLITCKSIMQLYIKPFRIVEGIIKSIDSDIDTRFEFEALPGKKFVLLRAAFNQIDNYIQDATFREISDEVLPAGGTEGPNNLDPLWNPTGRSRCEKSAGLNTGDVELQEQDQNPNSETYGQTRWVVDNTDLTKCPIGDPDKYLFGTDDASLDTANMLDFPFYEDPTSATREVTVNITNPGGEYIYFLHRDTLGLVEQVATTEQEEIISDFQYLTDVMVGGFTYKVLRQNYVTTDFVDFPITFIFNT